MKKIFLLLIIIILGINAFAQQKKISFRAGIGAAMPTGAELDQDNFPYLFTNFLPGGSITAGVQYNLGKKYKRFSLGANAHYTLLTRWADPNNTETASSDARFSNIALGISGKMRLLGNSKFSPYVFVEPTLNVFEAERAPLEISLDDYRTIERGEIIINSIILRYPAKKIDTGFSWGLNSGIGVEYNFSNSLSFFVQGNYNFVYASYKAQLQRNLTFLTAYVGVTFSFVKSKTLGYHQKATRLSLLN